MTFELQTVDIAQQVLYRQGNVEFNYVRLPWLKYLTNESVHSNEHYHESRQVQTEHLSKLENLAFQIPSFPFNCEEPMCIK